MKSQQADVLRMRTELDGLSFDVQALSKSIELNNERYLQREDELSREIKRLGAELSAPAVKRVETADERRRLTRAQQLSGDIRRAQQDIAAKRHEEELAAIALLRLNQHLTRFEGTSKDLSDAIQDPLQRAIAVLDESVASRKTLRALLEIEGEVKYAPPVAASTGSVPCMELQLAPASLAMDTASQQCLWYQAALGDSLRDEAELRATRFSTLEARHKTASSQLRDQAVVLGDAQNALSTLQDELQVLHQKITREEEYMAQLQAQKETARQGEPPLLKQMLEVE